jgi:hypothetical protein
MVQYGILFPSGICYLYLCLVGVYLRWIDKLEFDDAIVFIICCKSGKEIKGKRAAECHQQLP